MNIWAESNASCRIIKRATGGHRRQPLVRGDFVHMNVSDILRDQWEKWVDAHDRVKRDLVIANRTIERLMNEKQENAQGGLDEIR